jgi:hypothetical protein
MYMQNVDKAKMIAAMETKKAEASKEHAQNKATETLARRQLEDLRAKFRQRDTIDEPLIKQVKQTANLRLLEKAMPFREGTAPPPTKVRRTQ